MHLVGFIIRIYHDAGLLNVKFGSYEPGVPIEIIFLIKMCLNESSVRSVPFYKFVGFVACTEIVKQGCIKNAFFYFWRLIFVAVTVAS